MNFGMISYSWLIMNISNDVFFDLPLADQNSAVIAALEAFAFRVHSSVQNYNKSLCTKMDGFQLPAPLCSIITDYAIYTPFEFMVFVTGMPKDIREPTDGSIGSDAAKWIMDRSKAVAPDGSCMRITPSGIMAHIDSPIAALIGVNTAAIG